jgi:hypothetical protein
MITLRNYVFNMSKTASVVLRPGFLFAYSEVRRAATHPYPQKLALTSPTSGGRSVGIFRSRTQATEVFLFYDRK